MVTAPAKIPATTTRRPHETSPGRNRPQGDDYGGGLMNYCNGCDIAFESKYCPLCEANDQIGELKKSLKEAEDEIKDYKYEEGKE